MSLIAVLIAACALAQENVNPQALVLQDFDKRVAEYVKLQKSLAKGLSATKPTTEPQTIIDRQHELAGKLRAARSQASRPMTWYSDFATMVGLDGAIARGLNGARARECSPRGASTLKGEAT